MPRNKLTLGLLIFIGFIFGSAGAMKTFAAPEMVADLNELHFNSTWFHTFRILGEVQNPAHLDDVRSA